MERAKQIIVEGFLLPVLRDPREDKMRKVLECLKKDFRMSLAKIARQSGINLSRAHVFVTKLKKDFEVRIVKKGGDNEEVLRPL